MWFSQLNVHASLLLVTFSQPYKQCIESFVTNYKHFSNMSFPKGNKQIACTKDSICKITSLAVEMIKLAPCEVTRDKTRDKVGQ